MIAVKNSLTLLRNWMLAMAAAMTVISLTSLAAADDTFGPAPDSFRSSNYGTSVRYNDTDRYDDFTRTEDSYRQDNPFRQENSYRGTRDRYESDYTREEPRSRREYDFSREEQQLSRDYDRFRNRDRQAPRDSRQAPRDNGQPLRDDFDFGTPNREPVKKQEPTGIELVDVKLTSRYGNPAIERFIKGTSGQQFVNLYLETSRLIDARHLQPNSYRERVEQAVVNLKQAVENEQFLRAHGLNPSRQQVTAFQQGADNCLATRNIQTVNDAVNAMYCVATVASQTIGLNGNAVAAEFVYGAAESLDKYSSLLPEDRTGQPGAMLDVPTKTAGVMDDHVVGIGVEIKPHEDGIVVVKALRGGPAQAGGLDRGDVITSINGQSLRGRSLDYAVDLIKGQIGTPVLLGMTKSDGRETQVTLRRARVELKSVSEAKIIDSRNGVGYIKLDKFAATSDAEMDEALWSLYNNGMKSLVFDLRGNPGGLLTAAISISNKFVPQGNIVSTRGRLAEDNMSESATRTRTWKTPMVVLVDGNSASASEIFAAAIQENGRGLIVGRQSYGKGTVQTHFPLSTIGGNLKLTTAKFYSPNGREMAGAGVTPDVLVREGSEDLLVPLNQDPDVIAGYKAAIGQEVREMAAASERGTGYNSLSLR
ncbi:S41 family peptidase [Calycomorphotria hydatis]|uniref:Putative CtpA-like serine protease n=1 Tax=Calycomorphotria hydatis TaxID=2528027 RepID=A0A517TAL5_9PLAN|nr:S41 family peptidase [Calycomorphotria hydatis]QDT65412.1 putative CtpA-like serine protease [Calycomorphotria hydatis]